MTSATTQQTKAIWTVDSNSKARKGEGKMPEKFKTIVNAVKRSLTMTGKATGFKKYDKLKQRGKGYEHCHLGWYKKSLYVMVWTVDKKSKSITITDIGTHESVRY